MSTAQRKWPRMVLLVAGVGCMVLYVVWMLMPALVGSGTLPGFAQWSVAGTPAMFLTGNSNGMARLWLFLGLWLVTQWAFLRPLSQGPRGGTSGGRTQWAAVIGVAFVTMLLSTGFIATMLEMPDWWAKITTHPPNPGSSFPGPSGDNLTGQAWILTAMLILWAAWAAVFYIYWKQGDYLTKAGRVIGWLIRGSCLELLVAIPTHAWAYRRSSDCYCTRGSYTGLVFGFGVLFWAFGPGLVLLFMREKERRAAVLQRLCPKCGALLAADGSCDACGRSGV